MVSENPLDRAKQHMLRYQLEARGITDRRVLEAMAHVPRERFVPAHLQAEAYADRALPIDCEQTISQPYMVALMTQCLGCTGNEKVLEIGTGSGYQTAVLAQLAGRVVSVERHAKLSEKAGMLLEELGYRNVSLVCGDGTLGWPELAPYDRILVTAAAPECPAPLFDQLSEGGLLVIPLGDREYQTLYTVRKTGGRPEMEKLSLCRFVLLIGRHGWPESAAPFDAPPD